MIEVNNLRFTYQDQLHAAVDGISFEIAKGEIFGFLGPSGAGKSTTQKVLIKILKGYQGDIKIKNRPLQDWNAEFYETIGVGFELPNHYGKLTAKENLLFFSSFYKTKTRNPEELLKMVGLEDEADKKVENYSKGMKMRLNFVRALLHDPQILFFDEPTTGLDPVNARRLKDIILNEKDRGKTIFLTTHNMHDADELCDRVAFIVDGKLNITDSPHNMKLLRGKRKVDVEYGQNGSTKNKVFELDNLGNNNDFLKLIKNERIASIHSMEASLEDIFIQVTGKTL